MELEFEAWGTEVDVAFSVDKGVSFTTITTSLALEQDPKEFKLFLDITSRTIRIKFSSLENFNLSWIRLWVNPGAPR
jgi:hypothetical protein